MTTKRLLTIWATVTVGLVVLGILVGLNHWLNQYFLNYSMFGFTLFEIDLRMYGVFFVEFIFFIFIGGEFNAYLKREER